MAALACGDGKTVVCSPILALVWLSIAFARLSGGLWLTPADYIDSRNTMHIAFGFLILLTGPISLVFNTPEVKAAGKKGSQGSDLGFHRGGGGGGGGGGNA